MSNLVLRTITGTVFTALVMGTILLANRFPVIPMIVFPGFAILGVREFYQLFEKHAFVSIATEIGTIMALTLLLLYLGVYSDVLVPASLSFSIPVIFICALAELWRNKAHPILNIGTMVFGLFYVILPFVLMIELVEIKIATLPVLAGMFILIWSNDTFAYLTGKALGKTALFERISPNKTWEGTIGGVAFTVIAGAIIGYFTGHLLFWIGAAVVIAPCAIFGDLLESLFKRSLSIKDSGNIFPGHGGVLDRFDATLLVVPFFTLWYFLYLTFIR